MTRRKECPECGSSDLMVRGGISMAGGYGPNLLPGTGKWFTGPKVEAVICKSCGLVRYFADKETLAGITTERGWRRNA